jgi:hypothetical protein
VALGAAVLAPEPPLRASLRRAVPSEVTA